MSSRPRSAAVEDGPSPERLPEEWIPWTGHEGRIWHAPEPGAPVSGTPVDGPESGPPIEDLRLTEADDDNLQRLSVAVLSNAIAELSAPRIHGKGAEGRELARQQARSWLLSDSPSLRLWCDRAGLDCDALRSRLKARLPEQGDGDGDDFAG